jgi:hypothetical protein
MVGMPSLSRVAAALVALVVPLLGCAGDLPPKGDGTGTGQDLAMDWGYATPDLPTGQPDAPASEAAPLPDLPTVPDLGPSQPDLGLPTGGPCPCKAPLICANNACRAQCNAPTGPCKVSSNCPSTHACVEMNNRPGTYVCLPATGAGQACSLTVYCAVDHVCASVSNQPYICLPICSSQGASCGTSGGTCIASGACLYCSKP